MSNNLKRRYTVHRIFEGHKSKYDFGDVILETDSFAEAKDAAGACGPFGGGIYDNDSGLLDTGNGWQTWEDARQWLNTPDDYM